MKISAKLKKRILLAGILPVAGLLIIGGLLYFFLVYRFKDNIKYIVNKESNGRYAFDASEANISFWNKTVLLRGSVLYCKDSLNAGVRYTIRIPEMYFSLGSLKGLLFHKKIFIDSLSIIEPDISVDDHKINRRKEHPDFHASDLLNYLQQALSHLNVRSFSLKDASFTYERLNGPGPFHGDHINLSVSNFTEINNEDSHLLGSDKVSFYLGQQHWVFPDGKHEINFKHLSFDSKGQRFELDSFSYFQKAIAGKGEIKLHADKFFFTSQHLPAIYQKEQLLLDTLICVNPNLVIPGKGVEKGTQDPTEKVGFNSDLFKLINVKFVAVIDGELNLQNKDGITENTATRRANLSIFNLEVNSSKDPQISSDSIRINLKSIAFITKDSLYKLAIDEFAIRKKDAIFRNVRFGPIQSHPLDKKVVFTAPSLLLKDISIVDLLRKHIKASGAELNQPHIVLFDKEKGLNPGPLRSVKPSAKKMALFYRTLHAISELIDAPDFNIINGSAIYQHEGTIPLDATVKRLDAHILLNKFFISDSLVDIKHAIPDLQIEELRLASKGMQIKVGNFRFDGTHRHSLGEQVLISMVNGTELTGKNMYWRVFDWDIYQKTGDIQIDSLHFDEMTIHANAGRTGQPPSAPPHDLPVIRVARLNIGNIGFNGGSENNHYHFSVSDLDAEEVRSDKQFLTWKDASMNLHQFAMEGKKGKIAIAGIAFSSNKETIMKDLQFESAAGQESTRLTIPLIQLTANLNSSNFRKCSILSVIARDALFTYKKTTGKDTLSIKAGLSVRAENINSTADAGTHFRYDHIYTNLENMVFSTGGIRLVLPGSSLHLSDGHFDEQDRGRSSLHSSLSYTWKNASLTYSKDSIAISANAISGSFNDPAFSLAALSKMDWRQLAGWTTISNGNLHYKGKDLTADAGACSWDPSGKTLRLNSFSLIPRESREEVFKKAQWQGDYITVRGRSLALSGIRLGQASPDSLTNINELVLEGVSIDASRDKRMPFRHGIEKPMPTKLINTIPFPLKVDSIILKNCSVTYNEFSVSTKKWSAIPIEGLHATILHVSNRNNRGDTLKVSAFAKLFDGHIRHFSYEESYGDSLSGFSAHSYFSALDLTRFSQVSVPAAAVSITYGQADTAFSGWRGNMYATYGNMNFFYKDLKIKVLNKKDMNKGGLVPSLETWVANLILPDRKKKTTAIYVERDREKFIFNYWVKAQTSGLLSTLGIKSSKTYRRLYQKKYKQFSLPENPPQ